MRTDSVRVSDDALGEVRTYIEATYGKAAVPAEPVSVKVCSVSPAPATLVVDGGVASPELLSGSVADGGVSTVPTSDQLVYGDAAR